MRETYKAVRIIDSGDYVEYWLSDTLTLGKDERRKATGEKRDFDELSGREQVASLKRKVRYYENKRWEIMRLVNMNYDNRTSFLTLTFKDDIEDIDYANSEFRKFIKRLSYYLYKKESGLKYLATWEIQTSRAIKTGKEVIHYHIIMFDVPYIDYDKLTTIWGNGYVSINRVDDIENKGLYVSKYFAKDIDQKTHKKKAYFTSRNLKKPIEKKIFINENDIDKIIDKNLVQYQSVYKKTIPYYDNEFKLQFDQFEEVKYYSVRK